jgi:hypothetical protein
LPTGRCDYGDGTDYPPEMDEAYEQERRERAELVREAQDLLLQAIEKVEDAVRGTEIEDHTNAYVIAHLKILAGSDHGYLSHDANVDTVIRDLLGQDEDEDW